jgi:hypothetical protein
MKLLVQDSIMNKWEKLKNYVNSHDISSIIERQGILNYIEGPDKKYRPHTTDSYINILHKLGFIEKVSAGKYKILYHIKADLSVADATIVAFSASWRQWFNDFKLKESNII